MPNSQKTLIGSLDDLHAVRPVHHRHATAVRSGEKAVARGWIGTPDSARKIRRVFIDAGGSLQPVAHGLRRADVANKFGPKLQSAGFEGPIDIPADSGPDIKIAIHCVFEGEKHTPARLAIERYVRVVQAPLPTRQTVAGTGATSRVRRVTDELPGEPYFGRSRRSIRPGAPVEVSGWILDREGRPGKAAAVIVSGRDGAFWYGATRCFDGEAAVRTRSDAEAGFFACIDLDQLPLGLYSLAPAVLEADGSWTAGCPAVFERCSSEPRAANFLPFFRQPVVSCLERLEPMRPARGEPVAISGWAIDPLGTGNGLGVYARLGEHHFLALPAALKRPDAAAANGSPERDDIGFAGIIDTAHVLPGVHRLDVVLCDISGRGWYPVASREIEVV